MDGAGDVVWAGCNQTREEQRKQVRKRVPWHNFALVSGWIVIMHPQKWTCRLISSPKDEKYPVYEGDIKRILWVFLRNYRVKVNMP